MGGGGITFPVFALTSCRDRVTHSTHLPVYIPKIRICNQIAMQVLLKSWKAAGLEHVWESANFLPKWCKMVPEWSMA